jgi:hypothetical protein
MNYNYKLINMNNRQLKLAISTRLTIILTIIFFCFTACKDGSALERYPKMTGKMSSIVSSAQPLPGGKERFTWVNGNFDTSGSTTQRIVNLSFKASTGTVAATVWTWDSSEKKGKSVFNSHLCTFDGISKTCSTYTPWGWVYPTGKYVSWSGTYIYSGTTLSITWSSPSLAAGTTEEWAITNPNTALARASLISSSYNLTHGRGYGSNSSFTTYKTIEQMMPFPNFTATNSKRVAANASSETATPVITPSTGWTKASLNLSTFNTPSSPTPANTAHYYQPTSSSCGSSCTTTRTGIIYHLSSQNNSRHMAYHFFCACLPTATEFPDYQRNLHPAALTQILDDNDNLVALIGIESQNPSEAYYNGAYQYQLFDFNNIP